MVHMCALGLSRVICQWKVSELGNKQKSKRVGAAAVKTQGTLSASGYEKTNKQKRMKRQAQYS